MGIQDAFANLAQVTAEDQSTFTNLTTKKSTLTEKVSLYDNHLSTKDLDNGALKEAARDIQGDFKNLKYELSTLENASHSGRSGNIVKEKGQPDLKWKY